MLMDITQSLTLDYQLVLDILASKADEGNKKERRKLRGKQGL